VRPIAGARISRYVPGAIPALSSFHCEEMEKSSKRWPCRLPFLAALVAAAAAGLTGGALAVSPTPDPARGKQVSPRPDAAATTAAPSSRVRSSTLTPARSLTAPSTTTRSGTTTRAQSNTTPSRGSGDTPPKSTVLTIPSPLSAAATPAITEGKASGRDETLLLGAALALGTLTLASLGLLGLARRLRREVALR